MRKVTFAFLTSGCLALAVATFLMTNVVPPALVHAQGDGLVGGLCPAEPSCPGGPSNPKAEVCHYDLGNDDGHINCQNASSIDSHIGDGGHDRDYCAATTGGVCVKGGKPQ